MAIELGTFVEWTSQSGGYAKTKRGEVVEIVFPDHYPSQIRFPDLFKGVGIGSARDHQSYVVLVKTGKKAIKHYWPRASALRVVGE